MSPAFLLIAMGNGNMWSKCRAQGLACGNRPPRTAFPSLPALPPLPSTIDPDSWLQSLDDLHLERKIDRNGMLSIDLKRNSRLAQTGSPSGK